MSNEFAMMPSPSVSLGTVQGLLPAGLAFYSLMGRSAQLGHAGSGSLTV